MTWAGSLDVPRLVRDGVLLSVAASIVIMGALRHNPRLFLRHFPERVRRTQPPLSRAESRAGRVIGGLLIALLLVVPVWSARRSGATADYGVVESFIHAFLVGMTFNVTDWLVLDELWLGIGQPRWALPPGVVPADVPFDHRQHARGFLIGTILCAFVGVLAAMVSALW